MGVVRGGFGQDLLLDPAFWRPRLENQAGVPRQLILFPRPELGRPGAEVLELRLRAHDGARLQALLTRSSFWVDGDSVRLRTCTGIGAVEPDWAFVDNGGTDVVFAFPHDRPLEDRVLDVLRLIGAACSIESVDCSQVSFRECPEGAPDHFAIAELIRARGWI